MRLLDIVSAFGHPQTMSFKQDLAVSHTDRRLEFVAGELDPLPKRIAEVDRVKDAAVDLAGVLNAALFEPLRRLCERRARYGERQVMDIADPFRVGCDIDLAGL